MKLPNFAESSLPGNAAAFKAVSRWKEEEQSLSERFAVAKTSAGTQRFHASQPASETELRVKEYSNSTPSVVVSAVKNLISVGFGLE